MKMIDLEHHSYVKEIFPYLETRTTPPFCRGKIFTSRKDIVSDFNHIALNTPGKTVFDEVSDFDDIRLGIMDRAGVETAVISSGAAIEEFPREESIKFAKMTNDAVAAAIKRHPGRFLGTICLPTPYVDAALEELDRAVNVLGLQYWHTHSNFLNHYIYEEQFEPIFAKCAEMNIPFYVHPQYPADPFLLDSGPSFAGAGFGFAVDTTKTSLRLIMGGLFDRYPNLKMILGHMGEFYPYCLDRMNNRFSIFRDTDKYLKLKHDFTYYFKNKNIFMTTSGIYDPEVVMFVVRNIGVDNILFGTDYPYEDYKGAADFVRSLPISEADKEKICFRNAETYILRK